jgi:hypothetical protein
VVTGDSEDPVHESDRGEYPAMIIMSAYPTGIAPHSLSLLLVCEYIYIDINPLHTIKSPITMKETLM